MTWWRRPGFQVGHLIRDDTLNAAHEIKGLWFSPKSGDGPLTGKSPNVNGRAERTSLVRRSGLVRGPGDAQSARPQGPGQRSCAARCASRSLRGSCLQVAGTGR
jgi:hypothetical protein